MVVRRVSGWAKVICQVGWMRKASILDGQYVKPFNSKLFNTKTLHSKVLRSLVHVTDPPTSLNILPPIPLPSHPTHQGPKNFRSKSSFTPPHPRPTYLPSFPRILISFDLQVSAAKNFRIKYFNILRSSSRFAGC